MYESFLNVRFSHDSFFAMFNFLKGPMNWERVPSERERKPVIPKLGLQLKRIRFILKPRRFHSGASSVAAALKGKEQRFL